MMHISIKLNFPVGVTHCTHRGESEALFNNYAIALDSLREGDKGVIHISDFGLFFSFLSGPSTRRVQSRTALTTKEICPSSTPLPSHPIPSLPCLPRFFSILFSRP